MRVLFVGRGPQKEPIRLALFPQDLAFDPFTLPADRLGQVRGHEGWPARIAAIRSLDEPSRAAHRYAKLTSEQVRAAFARWIAVAVPVQVTEGPTPR